MSPRNEIAARVLAGFASNPAVFAPNPQCGWALVNCTRDQLASEALAVADAFIKRAEMRDVIWSQAFSSQTFHALRVHGHDPHATAWIAVCRAVCSGPPSTAAAGQCCPACLQILERERQ